MTKTTNFVQCTMHRLTQRGTIHTTSYLPQAFAKMGRVLKLRDESGRWTDGWIVDLVSETKVNETHVPDYRKAIRNHRKQSGDSTPRLTR